MVRSDRDGGDSCRASGLSGSQAAATSWTERLRGRVEGDVMDRSEFLDGRGADLVGRGGFLDRWRRSDWRVAASWTASRGDVVDRGNFLDGAVAFHGDMTRRRCTVAGDSAEQPVRSVDWWLLGRVDGDVVDRIGFLDDLALW